MVVGSRMLLWSIASAAGHRPYWISDSLQTAVAYVTRHVIVEARWDRGSSKLELHRDDDGWTVDGKPRPDLDGALDCDLAACPLTNTMPILRRDLHRRPGDHTFAMAFIEVPSLRVVVSKQRYTHLRLTDGSAIATSRSPHS